MNPGQRKSGAERLANISSFAASLRQKIGTVGFRLQGALSKVTAGVGGYFRSMSAPLLAGAQGAGAWPKKGFMWLRGRLDAAAAKTRGGYLKGWSAVTHGAAAFVKGLASQTSTMPHSSPSCLWG